ncbi:MAG: metal ABC transporter substrate-binding protein [Gemmataceae bacterium]
MSIPHFARRIVPVLVIASAFLSGCSKAVNTVPWPDKPGPKVVSTFPPITCLVANVLGDSGVVRGVMSVQGPHEFNATVAEAAAVAGGELFFINGLELDNQIAEKMRASSGNKSLTIVDLGAKIDEKRYLEMEHNHDHGAGHDHHHHGGFDPHIWLGPDMAILMVESIGAELKKIDPKHAADYDRRVAEYTAKLNKLLADGKAMLGGKPIKIITMHESMGYFARAYGIEIVGSVQPSPGQEPARNELDKLIATCIEKNVTVIAVEPQYGTSSAVRVIQRELKAKGKPELHVVELDPLETSRDAIPPLDFYETKMRENLKALAEAAK